MRCTDLLLPLVPNCLLESQKPASPIKSWFQAGDYEYDLASSSSPIPIIRNATRSFEPTLASEVDRFLCAMGESFSELRPSNFASRSISWALIRAYYSSYFAAHALLRMTGCCVTHIDAGLSQTIMRALQINGAYPRWQISTSQYSVKYDEKQQLLSFEEKHNAKGGSHQFVWKKFGDLLTELISSCKRNNSVYQAELLLFERISEILTFQQRAPDFSWLSSVRNSVNYSFAHSAWFPFSGMETKHSVNLMRLLKCQISQDSFDSSSRTQSDLEKFCEASSFLVSFANASANALVSRSNSKPFLSKGFVKLQKLVNMPR
jgi:hypothetical protein